jgi:hypothetical protein
MLYLTELLTMVVVQALLLGAAVNEDEKILSGVHRADTAAVDGTEALGGIGTSADNVVLRMEMASIRSRGQEDGGIPYTQERIACLAAPTSRGSHAVSAEAA